MISNNKIIAIIIMVISIWTGIKCSGDENGVTAPEPTSLKNTSWSLETIYFKATTFHYYVGVPCSERTLSSDDYTIFDGSLFLSENKFILRLDLDHKNDNSGCFTYDEGVLEGDYVLTNTTLTVSVSDTEASSSQEIITFTWDFKDGRLELEAPSDKKYFYETTWSKTTWKQL